jgi:transposase
MILTHSVKVCLATQSCDLRKSFDTLSVLVEQELHEDPLCSKLFVFLNKKCDRVKMLYWDGTGLWILAKRLERGRFKRPLPAQAPPQTRSSRDVAQRDRSEGRDAARVVSTFLRNNRKIC